MSEVSFAYAFAAGMFATVNPCGFALLPAYLSYFLGLEGAASDTRASILRALMVTGAVTAGFALVFGLIGLVVLQLLGGISAIGPRLPWVTMGIGMVLMVLGVAIVRGFQLTVRLPKVSAGTTGRELTSMFVFGISYAVASLSCSLPVFLIVLTGALGAGNLMSGLSLFLVYAAGMGVLLAAITVALAAAKDALVHRIRRAQPQINRASGVLLVVAGAYLIYYGYWARGVFADPKNPPPAGPVALVESIESTVRNWVSSIGAIELGIVIVATITIALISTMNRRRQPDDARESAPPEPTSTP